VIQRNAVSTRCAVRSFSAARRLRGRSRRAQQPTLPVIGFLTSLGRNDRTDLAEACNYPSSRPISKVLHSPEGRLVDLRLSIS
jgi:hypothetical protein